MNQKKLIIISLLVAVFLFSLWLLGNSSQKGDVEEKTLPTPTSSFQPNGYTGKGDLDVLQKIEEQAKTSYPLIQFMPHKDSEWSLDYIGPSKLEATLKTDTPAVRQEVLGWISSKGIDPTTHEIVWKASPGL